MDIPFFHLFINYIIRNIKPEPNTMPTNHRISLERKESDYG